MISCTEGDAVSKISLCWLVWDICLLWEFMDFLEICIMKSEISNTSPSVVIRGPQDLGASATDPADQLPYCFAVWHMRLGKLFLKLLFVLLCGSWKTWVPLEAVGSLSTTLALVQTSHCVRHSWHKRGSGKVTCVKLLKHSQDFWQVRSDFLVTLNLLMMTNFYVRTNSTFYCLGLYVKSPQKSTRNLRRDIYFTIN